MEKLKELWKEWRDELLMVVIAFGSLALVSIGIVLMFGVDAAPFDLGVVQRIFVTIAKFTCFHVVALAMTWFLYKKWDGFGTVYSKERWEITRVYFLFLAALVLLSFT